MKVGEETFPEEINILKEYNIELKELQHELETQSKLMEFYNHAMMVTAIVAISFSIIWEKHHLSIGLVPMVIYFFIRFLNHRRLRQGTKRQFDIVKQRFMRSYGL